MLATIEAPPLPLGTHPVNHATRMIEAKPQGKIRARIQATSFDLRASGRDTKPLAQ